MHRGRSDHCTPTTSTELGTVNIDQSTPLRPNDWSPRHRPGRPDLLFTDNIEHAAPDVLADTVTLRPSGRRVSNTGALIADTIAHTHTHCVSLTLSRSDHSVTSRQPRAHITTLISLSRRHRRALASLPSLRRPQTQQCTLEYRHTDTIVPRPSGPT